MSKQVETELKQRLELQDQLAQIAATVPGAIYSFRMRPDGSSCVPYASPTLEQIFGVTPESIREDATAVFASIHPDDRVQTNESILTSYRNMTPWRCEFRLCKPGKAQIWAEGNSVPHLEADGSVLWRGFIHDITERKRLQSELALRERQLNSFFTRAAAGLVLFDERQRYLRINHTQAEINGLPAEQHVGRTVAEVAPEIAPTIEPVLRQVLATGEPVLNVEVSAERGLPSDRRHWVESFFPIPGPQGAPEGVGVVVVEITERKRAEAALQASEARYRALVETSFDWIWEVDISGRYTYASPKVHDLLGYKPEEVLGHTPFDLMPQAEARRVGELFVTLAAERKPFAALENINLHKDGRLVVLESSGVPVFGPNGDYQGYRGMDRDITERKRMEEERWALEAQMRQQQRLESLGTLAGGVDHEINNPINGVMNYAQLIQDRLAADSPLTEYTKEILHETQRVATIVRNLLTFARDERQNHSQAHLKDILEGALSLIRTIIRHDQIMLTVTVPEGLPAIRCRSQQIQQVLMNLMTNARDALNARYPGHDANKLLNVFAQTAEKDGLPWIQVTVEDHGTGIAPEVRDRMFDPFYTTKPRDKGTGLGLSISHGIVKEHGGKITVESVSGEFTRMHLLLPVASGGES